MSFSPIGDTIAVTNLVWTLYRRVVAVARTASTDFKDWSTDLYAMNVVLQQIRDLTDVNDSLSRPVKIVLGQCFGTLQKCSEKISKYENLAQSDRGHVLKKLQWALDQDSINELRNRLNSHQHLLQLALTSEGRAKLTNDIESNNENNETLRKATTFGSATTIRDHRASLGTISTRIESGSIYARNDSVSRAPLTSLRLAQRSHSLAKSETSCSSCSENVDEAEDTQSLAEEDEKESEQGAHGETVQEQLHIDRQKITIASPEIGKRLKEQFESMQAQTSTELWLRIGIWWLVKSRVLARLADHAAAGQQETDTSDEGDWSDATPSKGQAYYNLLKSSYILDALIDKRSDDLSYSHNRKLFTDLFRSLQKDLHKRQTSNTLTTMSEQETASTTNLHLIENFKQAIEAEDLVPMSMDDLASPHRWVEVDQDNCGFQNERILYRTFVDAQLGTKSQRSKSSSAPYMLLLWTKATLSDLFVSLCNQRGTVNLCKKMEKEDIATYENTQPARQFMFGFPSQEAEVRFGPSDIHEFFSFPRRYFAATVEKNALPGELVIHQTSVRLYQDLTRQSSDNMPRKELRSKEGKSSCGLTIYESSGEECWRTTRRLVVSSAPDKKDDCVACVSHWLPLDQIRITLDGPVATIQFSDCGQLKKKEPENYVFYHSYEYDSAHPNREIRLDFANGSEARKVRECLLSLTGIPDQIKLLKTRRSSSQICRVYQMRNANGPKTIYHAISLVTKTPRDQVATVYYVYRDLDWSQDLESPLILTFPRLTTPIYISDQTRIHGRPKATDPPPKCHDIGEGVKPAQIVFGCVHSLESFMLTLTGWRLKYFARVVNLAVAEMGINLGSKKEHKQVGIQLWESPLDDVDPTLQRTHLAVRLNKETPDRWITSSLYGVGHTSKHGDSSYSIELQGLNIQRGFEIDTQNLTATTHQPSNRAGSKKRWKIIITFETREDKRDFMMCSGLFTM